MTAPRPTPRPAPGVLPHGLHQAAPDTAEFEVSLASVEQAITTLGEALARPDPAALETAAGELQTALRAALQRFAQVARAGTVPPPLRKRLALASGQVAAQREALFRATTALDQALEILIPRPASETAVYSAQGANQRGPGRVIASS